MKIRNLLLGAMIFAGTLNAAEFKVNKMNALTMHKLELAKKHIKSPNLIMETKQVQYPYSIQNNQLFVNLLIKVSGPEVEAQLLKLGCDILTHTKTIYSVKAPVTALDAISELKQVIGIEASQKYKRNMDVSKKAINAENVSAQDIVPFNIIGGEGVIVGIYDTGIDWTHADFSNENGTRILKLWDMSDQDAEGPAEYDDYDWGKEYSKADIDNSSASVMQLDKGGHGTHVAGTAAGGGKVDSKFKGIAYNSDLIIVKGVRDDEKDSFSDNDIIAGCDYIIKEAKKLNKPLVINLSLGGLLGPHDGKSFLSQSISDLAEPGVVFSISAGNEGEMPIHAGGFVNADATVEFPILPQNICEMIEDFNTFCDTPNAYMTAADFWYSKGTVKSIELVAYDLMSAMAGNPQIAARQTFPLDASVSDQEFRTEGGVPLAYISFNSSISSLDPNSGNFGFYIHNGGDVSKAIDNYIWSIAVQTNEEGTIDMWGGIPMPALMPFQGLLGSPTFSGDNTMMIGSPGDGDSVICVGAFTTKNSWTDMSDSTHSNNWTIGDIASFSSRGPSRDGRILPLISAPGHKIFAAKSKDYETDPAAVLAGEKYVGMSGTSMSAPHVAGAIALMLQVNPKLGYSEIVDVLFNTAKKDNFTTGDRTNTFGLGKIDVQAAIDYLMGNTGVDYVYANDVKVYPNPAVNSISFELNSDFDANNLNLAVFNSMGEKVSDNLKFDVSGSKLNLNISSLASGIYNVECQSDKSIAKFRFVVK